MRFLTNHLLYMCLLEFFSPRVVDPVGSGPFYWIRNYGTYFSESSKNERADKLNFSLKF